MDSVAATGSFSACTLRGIALKVKWAFWPLGVSWAWHGCLLNHTPHNGIYASSWPRRMQRFGSALRTKF